jgi:MFS superfamily sulfate permease-like transporter
MPTMIGYMNGLALTILIGQLPKLFGFKVEAEGLIREFTGLVKGLANGEAVAAAAVTGIAGIALILVLQRWLPKVPAVLIMVVLAIAATSVVSRNCQSSPETTRHTFGAVWRGPTGLVAP